MASAAHWRALGLLAVLVAALHGALLTRWPVRPTMPSGRSGTSALPRVAVTSALPRAVLTLPQTGPARVVDAPQANPGPRVIAPAMPLRSKPSAAAQAAAADAPPSAAPSEPALSVGTATPTATPEAVPDAGDEPPMTAAALSALGATSAAAPGTPPPVYATRIPEPGQWHYTAQIGQRSGRAVLSWQHDGERYRLQLQADGPAGPLLQQVSTGGFDAAGLAPERFTDRRRARGERAANFQRESGRITFSGPRIEYPAWAGAQDRLGWIVQLAAIASAAGVVPPEVALFVVDGRGVGDVWTFVNQGQVLLDTPVSTAGAVPATAIPTTAIATTHVLREPQRAWDWRVEAWLDARQGFWPLRLRMTAPRGGAVFELQAVSPAPAR